MNKLYRSQKSSMIAGVCGGLGNYFGIDPTIIRLTLCLPGLLPFPWCLGLPGDGHPAAAGPPEYDRGPTHFRLGENSQTTKVIGGGLVIIGLLAVISTLIFPGLAG